MYFSDVIGLTGILEFPLTILGSYLLWKKISKSKELQDWIGILRESKDILKKLESQYKKANGKKP